MCIYDNVIYIKSLRNIFDEVDVSFLENKTVLITGAYGMIGSCLIDSLMLWNNVQKNPCTVIGVGRNINAAKERFRKYYNSKNFKFYCQDITEKINDIFDDVDYIIHAASNADPVHIAKNPVNTLMANVVGTNNLLEYGIKHGMKRFMYISSGEMYGYPYSEKQDFTEDYSGYLDYSNPRSCYPAGKRAAEVLCQSYISEFGVDAVIVRPCHIFGPTMMDKDSRAVSEFFRNAADNKKIVLKSSGIIERSHCYVIDAVKAIFIVLRDGLCGEAYNIADKKYQMTIKEIAERIARTGNNGIEFVNPNSLEVQGYSKVKRAVLSAAKLEDLGWNANEEDAIEETIKVLKLDEIK